MPLSWLGGVGFCGWNQERNLIFYEEDYAKNGDTECGPLRGLVVSIELGAATNRVVLLLTVNPGNRRDCNATNVNLLTTTPQFSLFQTLPMEDHDGTCEQAILSS